MRRIRISRPSKTKRWGIAHLPVRQTLVFTPVAFILIQPRRKA